MKIESTFGEIYKIFAARFPKEKSLWEGLAKEEDVHARMFLMCRGFQRAGIIPEMTPECITMIDETMELVRMVKEKALRGELSLDQALETAFSLEFTSVERYLSELVAKTNEGDLKKLFSTLLSDGRSHAQRIKDAMVRNGCLK